MSQSKEITPEVGFLSSEVEIKNVRMSPNVRMRRGLTDLVVQLSPLTDTEPKFREVCPGSHSILRVKESTAQLPFLYSVCHLPANPF